MSSKNPEEEITSLKPLIGYFVERDITEVIILILSHFFSLTDFEFQHYPDLEVFILVSTKFLNTNFQNVGIDTIFAPVLTDIFGKIIYNQWVDSDRSTTQYVSHGSIENVYFKKFDFYNTIRNMAHISYLSFADYEIKNCYFTGHLGPRLLVEASWLEEVYIKSDITDVSISGSCLRNVTFYCSQIDNLHFFNDSFHGIKFLECEIINISFIEVRGFSSQDKGIIFENCVFIDKIYGDFLIRDCVANLTIDNCLILKTLDVFESSLEVNFINSDFDSLDFESSSIGGLFRNCIIDQILFSSSSCDKIKISPDNLIGYLSIENTNCKKCHILIEKTINVNFVNSTFYSCNIICWVVGLITVNEFCKSYHCNDFLTQIIKIQTGV